MKVFAAYISAIILLVSCDKGNDYYTYLSDPDTLVETVRMRFETSADEAVFDYTIRAKELYIDWGNGLKPHEFVFFDDIGKLDSIKALHYAYTSRGTFNVTVKALQLRSLLLSRSGENAITELNLTNCIRLRNLFCDNQPISELDVSECPDLRILSCGHADGELLINGLPTAAKLGELYINGPVASASIELQENDSLRTIGLSNTNLPYIQLTGLEELAAIEIYSCSELRNIYIGNNSLLSEIVLTDNPDLDAGALNVLFESLPPAGNTARHITLWGNKGDSRCDRSIAAAKGWVFR